MVILLLVDLPPGESVGQKLFRGGPGRCRLIDPSEEPNQGDHTENHQRPKQHHADCHQRISPAGHSWAIPEHHFCSFYPTGGARRGSVTRQRSWSCPARAADAIHGAVARRAGVATKVPNKWPKGPCRLTSWAREGEVRSVPPL